MIALLLNLTFAQAVPIIEYQTKIIDNSVYICHYDLASRLVCRPVTDLDTVCIPDPYSGDGSGCHTIELRKGFNP